LARFESFPSWLPLAVAISCVACGTAYQPANSGHIGLVIHRGAAFYVKDGREVPIGPLGGALEPLVDTSPAAAAHARRAGRQLAVGVPLYLLSAATIIVGIASSRPPLHWTLIGSGAAGAATGLGLMGAGVTNIVDAVNIYNDAARPSAPP
jgi:hypothetical protein